MLNFADNFLNKTTMYRLVLYVLVFLYLAALILSLFGVLPYSWSDLIASVVVITAVSFITNFIFARVYEAPDNVESIYITALILVFIITPPQMGDYSQYLTLAIWASIWSMASKYIFAVRKKHIFNPAALAVALTALTINQPATWWVGTIYMLPFVLIGGFLVVRKMRRTDLVSSFFVGALVTIVGMALYKGANPTTAIYNTLIRSSFFFFAFIMLTEPLTTPPRRWLRIAYGALVGFLFAPNIHIGAIYFTPELALIAGNVFSYAVSPKEKLILKLKDCIKIASDTYDFVFANDKKFKFKPGQYMEWTLKHRDPDSRGNRRYFTIASAPTESDVRIGIKFYPEPSSFKNHLANLPAGAEIVASQRAGDFVLPANKNQKLVFIAGGIGVTPFRSMIKHLLDMNEERNIILLYSNKTVADIAYKDIFDSAQMKLGIKTVYAITDPGEVPAGWTVRRGFIDANLIKGEVPDYLERTFYISGPHGMVSAFEVTLKNMGVKRSNIKTDYFPGFT